MKQILPDARTRGAFMISLAMFASLGGAAVTGCTSNDASVQSGDTTSLALPPATSPSATTPSATTPSATSPSATMDTTRSGAAAQPGGSTTEPTPAPPAEPTPAPTAGGFHNENGQQVYDARKSIDVTGDGRPETIVVHARGATVDKAAVQLSIRDASGKSLYSTGWNTESYFKYTPRKGMSASAAASVVIHQLGRVLADSAFIRKTAKPDRDAIRYDLKEAAVRAKHSLSPDAPLKGSQLDEVEKYVVPESDIDAIVKEVTGMPTFTYHAGGELTYTIAWSKSKQRFVRIFSCC